MGISLYFLYKDAKKTEGEEKSFPAIQKVVQSKEWTKFAFYAVGLMLMYASIHGIYFFDNYQDWGQGLATFYEISFRPTFIFGLALILYPSIIGHGQLLLDIIGHPIFSALGKVTYGAYLLHPILLYYLAGYSLSGHFANHSWMLFNWSTLLFFSYVISLVVTTIFECPMTQALRKYLDPIRKPYLPLPENKTKDS